ncbi:MAG TPA: hypothetical protein VF068_12790 [Rubrobacter sp.]
MDERARQIEGRLAVREEEGAFFVVQAGDPEDWLARFEKDGEFPAREWAENMVHVYNRRLVRRSVEITEHDPSSTGQGARDRLEDDAGVDLTSSTQFCLRSGREGGQHE